MAYTPTTWVEGVTSVGPTNLNHLETGLQTAAAVADTASTLATAALPTPAGSNGQFLKRVAGVWVPTTFAATDIPNYPSDGTKALFGDGTFAQVVKLVGGTGRSVVYGTATLTFSAASNVTSTVTHGLGTTPVYVLATAGIDGPWAAAQVGTFTSTQFTLKAHTTDASTFSGNMTVYWLAVG